MKKGLGIDVFEAAQQRIAYTFDNFEKIIVRQAYMQGWDDAEKNMYEKAEALLEVVRAAKEGE